jgi:hypothetical protein
MAGGGPSSFLITIYLHGGYKSLIRTTKDGVLPNPLIIINFVQRM